MGVKHRDLIHFAPQKFLDAEFRDCLRLGETRRIFQVKSANIRALCARQIAWPFAPGDDISSSCRIELRQLRESGWCSTRRTSPLSVLMMNTSSFFDVALLQQRMESWICPLLQAKPAPYSSACGVRAARRARCCCALRILDAATICMALVICAVFWTDLIRRRMSACSPSEGVVRLSPAGLEFVDRRLQLRPRGRLSPFSSHESFASKLALRVCR